MATFSFEEALGQPATVAPTPKPRPVQPVVMPQPAASAPDPLVAAMQTMRSGAAPAAAAAPVAAPAMPALPPPPAIQPGEAPVNYKRRLSDYYQNIEKMKLEAAAPAKTKDMPAAFSEKQDVLKNFEGGLKAYKDELDKNLTVFPKEIPLVPSQGMAIPLPVGEDTARMNARFTTVLMGLKDAYKLGALAGPDIGILLSQLTNPASVSGMMTSTAGLKEQVKVLEDILQTSKNSLESSYGRKINYDLPSASAGTLPAAPALGGDPLMLRRR